MGTYTGTAYFDNFPYTKKPRPYAAGYFLETESFYSVYEKKKLFTRSLFETLITKTAETID